MRTWHGIRLEYCNGAEHAVYRVYRGTWLSTYVHVFRQRYSGCRVYLPSAIKENSAVRRCVAWNDWPGIQPPNASTQ